MPSPCEKNIADNTPISKSQRVVEARLLIKSFFTSNLPFRFLSMITDFYAASQKLVFRMSP